jgi:hypothetical protein
MTGILGVMVTYSQAGDLGQDIAGGLFWEFCLQHTGVIGKTVEKLAETDPRAHCMNESDDGTFGAFSQWQGMEAAPQGQPSFGSVLRRNGSCNKK